MKEQLIQNLRRLGAFWSYAPQAPIPDAVLIEEVLRWGDVAEIQALFRLYATAEIRKVWRETLIPDTRIYPHNYYLALIFFNIKNPKRYILPLQKKYSRYERLKQLIA
ncbi:hypothetical protein C7N43_16690 [Sphingobacteriales bacterium UPWRP_1]|nr:hypothetical protein C7N43_16690 [Sphingobacteriales bacterium UPWRP_1]